MPDVAGELGDEQQVSLSAQRPDGSGVGLGDGAGEWWNFFYRSSDGQELPVEGGVPGLGVGESTAEEGERLKPPSIALMRGHHRWRCRRRWW